MRDVRRLYPPAGTAWRPMSLHRTVLGMRVGKVSEDLFVYFSLEFAIGTFGDFDQIEVLDRIIVRVELEAAAKRGEVRLLQRRPQCVFIGGIAFGQLQCAIDQEYGVIRLKGVSRRDRAIFLLIACNELFVLRIVEVGRPIGAAEKSDGSVLLSRQSRFIDRECREEHGLAGESGLAELFDEIDAHAAG